MGRRGEIRTNVDLVLAVVGVVVLVCAVYDVPYGIQAVQLVEDV